MSRLDPSRPSTPGHRFVAAVALALTLPVMTIMGCPFKADVFQFRCLEASDCDDGNECTVDACDASVCSNTLADKGTPCAAKKSVCDGEGACVQCLSNKDCTTNHITTPICDLAQQKCVSCTDGKKNGKETNVDCGGPDCGACLGQPCTPEVGCGQVNGNPGFCQMQDGICCESACVGTCEACSLAKTGKPDGTCAPIPFSQDPDSECAALGGCGEATGLCACQDGAKNGTESDVDCGGTSCGGCGGGKMCLLKTDCLSSVPECVNNACCESECLGACKACNGAGLCQELPPGSPHPKCLPNQACGKPGNDCVGVAGQPCSSNGQCVSDSCLFSGVCDKSGLGKPCSTTTDCANGTCQNFICQ